MLHRYRNTFHIIRARVRQLQGARNTSKNGRIKTYSIRQRKTYTDLQQIKTYYAEKVQGGTRTGQSWWSISSNIAALVSSAAIETFD